MTVRSVLRTAPLLVAALLAGCVPGPAPERVSQRPVAPASPAPAPMAQQPGTDLQDWIVTPGTWSYARDSRSTVARFGTPGAAPIAWLRCDLGTRAISVGRIAGAPGSAMLGVLTSFGRSDWPAQAVTEGVEASRSATDPGLDAIAFSRGRFALMLTGATPLVLPTWAEPARVVEDCRG